MKHKYNKLAMLGSYAFYIILLGFVVYLSVFLKPHGLSGRNSREGWAFLAMLALTVIGNDYKNKLNRYVEFFDTYVCINAVSIKPTQRVFNLNVKYEDINKISSKKFPILGIRRIYIEADNFGYKIPLTWYYTHYIDMFTTLYERVSIFNPKSDIDKNLLEFLEKKGKI